MTAPTITLTGWTHVQTWRESHGNGTQETYQREPDPAAWKRRVECVVFSFSREGACDHVRTESDRDYLLARDIRANPDRYVKGRHRTEPCCTAGSDDFEEPATGKRWRIFGAAGHGEWAFEIDGADQ